ncbi:MAG: hypothetical protein LBB55_02680 [Zoogloeaceae bacterium]|nr:hypothetical protein [Zoogloeaceae bacterium]
MRLALALVLICCLLFAARPVRAESQRSVYWAGFAFTGEYARRHSITPASAAVIEKHGLIPLNATLYTTLRDHPPKHFALIGDSLARLDGSTSATVLAAALDRELVSVEPIGGKYKLLIEVALEALFFDYRDRQVIAAYPVTLQYIDLLDHPPGKAEIQAIVADLLYGDTATSLPRALAQTLTQARLPEAAMKRLQVGEVEISAEARAALPRSLSKADKERDLRMTLAHEFSKLLSTNTNIGLLPYARGEAVGATMAARFSDGRVFQLKIPAADYQVRLRLDRFVERVHEEDEAMRLLLFGAFFTVKVVDPFLGTVFFDQPLRKGELKTVPSTQTGVDHWAAWYETLLGGLDTFAGATVNRSGTRDWLSQQKPGGSALNQQISSLQELIASCR